MRILCLRLSFMQSGFSAVGSALRSGRRGRAFESPNPDTFRGEESEKAFPFLFYYGVSRRPRVGE